MLNSSKNKNRREARKEHFILGKIQKILKEMITVGITIQKNNEN